MKETKEIRVITGTVPEIRMEGEAKKIVGYAVEWERSSKPIMGMFTEKFRKGAFSRSLVNPDVYAAWQHDVRDTIGRTPNTLKLFEDDIGLRYEIDPPSWAERFIESIERGDVKGSSFIFRATKDEWDDSDPEMSMRTVIDADLMEVSPVTNPAYPTSSAGVRSAEEVYQSHVDASKSTDDTARELKHQNLLRQLEIKSREV